MTVNRKKLVEAIKEIASVGVGRNARNEAQGYMYRSADDVLNTVTPILAKYGICACPFFTIVGEDKTIQGQRSQQTRVRVQLALTLYDTEAEGDDARLLETMTYGDAQDTGDKAIMKAQTVALKYALIYGLGIPVIGTENDPDSTSPEVEPNYNPRVGGGMKKTQDKATPPTPAQAPVQQQVQQPAPSQKTVEQPPVKKAEEVKVPEKKEVASNISDAQIEALRAMGIEM